ncbi:MAG: response regulator transcription factor [Clostridiales bacterium]|nr:response regulator transcription factor [Clostridiales bacterium]
MFKIYIVEDDDTIAKELCRHIELWGMEAACATDFRFVLEEFLSLAPQLVLMDISLPFFNGYHWCEQIRRVSKVPILFLSSAADNMNMIMAINLGADDFIAKPFDLNVLTAKMQALLRRSYDYNDRVNLISHKGALLNLSDATLTYQNERLDLSKNDFRILQTLMENRGSVVSRDTLMHKLWETDSFVDENTLSVNVARLRGKLALLGLTDFITTKKGLGYIVE